MIKKCVCDSSYQDTKHGHKMRVCNPMKKGVGPRQYRCTVCGKAMASEAKAKK